MVSFSVWISVPVQANARLRAGLQTTTDPNAVLRSEASIEVAGFVLPQALHAVADRLERSRTMLDLEEDWDGEGSRGYEEATWRRAATLVVTASVAHYRRGGSDVALPVITKGDDGSIDLQWRTPTRNILINVPADVDQRVSFFAHDRANLKRDLGGDLEPAANNEWLLAWLTP